MRNVLRIVVLCCMAAMVAGCPRPEPQCAPMEMRCNEQRVEVCDSAQQWSHVADCEQVSEQSPGTWECLDNMCVRISEEE